MNKIYHYVDAADFLKDSLDEIKKRNQQFSLRAWAYSLGFKSHGPLHAILNKKRAVPAKLVPALVKSLKLDKKEAQFLEAMVLLQKTKNADQKEFYIKRLQSLRPKNLRHITDIDSFKAITDPAHIIIAELSQLKSFELNALWVKKHLRMSLSIKQINEILTRLQELGILKTHGKKVIKSVDHIYTAIEVENKDVQKYHKRMMELGIEELSNQSLEDREFNSIAFNLNKADLPELKKDIRNFIDKMIKKYESPAARGDETYQLCSQLYSLTKS